MRHLAWLLMALVLPLWASEPDALLGKALKGKDWRDRGEAAQALLARNAPGDYDLALTAAADKDGRVVQFLCEGLGKSPDPRALEALSGLLVHQDWRVRAAAVEAMGGRPEKEKAVPILAERLKKEEGRLLDDLRKALTRLVGQDLGPGPGAWQRWVLSRREGAEAEMPGAEEAFTHDGVTYHEVTTHSKRILFVLDCSNSMKQGDRIGKEKAKMIETLQGLPKGVSFNILTFSEDVHCWQPTLVPATEKNKAEACAFIEGLTLTLATNTWAAMKTALDMARGREIPSRQVRKQEVAEAPDADGEPVKGYGKRDADTLFLMSDGMPWLDGKPQDWNEIADKVRDYNRTKRVVIHTVGVGEALDPFMKRLAEENGGTYTKVP